MASDPEVTATGAMGIAARASGNGSQRGPGFEVRSPVDGAVLASLPDLGAEAVGAAVARLRRDQPAWEALGPTGRGEWVGRLEVGAVNVNDMFANVAAFPIPQGGWKQSGVGTRLGGAHGIRKFCHPQAITATRLAPRSELLWYPYTARKGKLALRLTRFLFARDWHRRLARRRP